MVRQHESGDREKLNLKAYDIYGLTEIIGPGVSCECEAQNGLHINEDYFYPEIINPETGEVLPEGEKGELVFTTLSRRELRLSDTGQETLHGSLGTTAHAGGQQ